MKVGILGSGLMGAKLGTLFAQAGHDVMFSYSRDPKKLEKLAKEAGSRAKAGTPKEAVEASDVLLLAVNWPQLEDLLKKAGDLSGKIIINCSLPMNADNSAFAISHDKTSAPEELAKRFPKAHVAMAFNTVPSEVFFDVFERRKNKKRPHVVFCASDAKAKKAAAQLISDVGFEPLDVGDLKMARYAEPFTMLVAQIAYEGKNGPRVAYRFEWLGGSENGGAE